jgi:hypothetical protein
VAQSYVESKSFQGLSSTSVTAPNPILRRGVRRTADDWCGAITRDAYSSYLLKIVTFW